MPRLPIIDTTRNGCCVGFLAVVGDYKPGDPPPGGYGDWREWAKVQVKAGLKQKRCSLCGRLNFPQEIARTETRTTTAYRTKRDAAKRINPATIETEHIVCLECDETSPEPEARDQL